MNLTQERYRFQIKPLQKLKGGKSGALLYLISVSFFDSNKTEHLVLKLDTPIQWDDVKYTEAERHRTALTQAPPDFVQEHMASLRFDPVDFEDAIAIFYTIAGDSLQLYRPVESFNSLNKLEKIFNRINTGLLVEWNKNRKTKQAIHPQEILEKWLGYRIKLGEGRIESFLQETCGIDPQTSGLIIQEKVYPNPLAYAREKDYWGNTRRIDALVGFLHGDLNTNNVLVHFSRDGEELGGYYLIDFAQYDESAYLLYDHLYLELSYLIQHVSKARLTKWADLITMLAENDMPEPSDASAESTGLCATVVSARKAFDHWIQQSHPTMYDDLWGQYRLAAVAAGLNFCNKSTLSKSERFAALVYAAAHLKKYSERFEIAMPAEAQKLALVDEEASEELENEWEPFLEACHGFSEERINILVVGPQFKDSNPLLSTFGRVGWNLVLDFDPDTEKSGLYKVVAKEIEVRRSLHLVTCDDRLSLNPIRATYWYAARGLTGRATTLLPNETWREWNQKYPKRLSHLFEDLLTSSDQLPVTVLILWDAQEYVDDVCKLIDQTFGNRANFIFAMPNHQALLSISTKYNKALTFSLRPDQIATGFGSLFSSVPQNTDQILLPSNDTEPVVLKTSDVYWLQEELTLAHLGLGAREDDGRQTNRDFLRGNKISWFELGIHCDVDRNKTEMLEKQAKDDLQKRLATRINLYHGPGAGGTTVALRVAWNLHKIYPTVLLRRVSHETLGRFRLIYDYTGTSILAIVEGSDISPDVLEMLYSQIRSEQLPIVFLNVSRRFGAVTETARTVYLPEILHHNEANYFASIYSKESPGRKTELMALSKEDSKVRFRVPFYFGLVAFREDFVQLDSYVRVRLDGMAAKERKIMGYLCLAYKYTQRALPAHMFCNIIGTTVVSLEQALTLQRRDLLINEHRQYWRPAHDLIAREVLEQILAGNSPDRRVWYQNLSTWATDLIQDCARLQPMQGLKPSDFVLELLRRLFVFRDDFVDIWNPVTGRPEFSRLIQEIREPEGQLAVLQNLVECFPEEPHFWAHLARFFSYRGDHQKALTAANKALEFEPQQKDDVLHHIRGMVLRQWAFALMKGIEKRIKKNYQPNKDELQEIDKLLEQAEDEFVITRQIAPEDEHPYVSHIQLLVRAVEFGFKKSGKLNYTEFLTDPQTISYQEMVGRAEDVLEEVKHLNAGRQVSEYVQKCENELSELCDDYAQIILRWTSFLGQRGVYAPPVRRRLVRVYLAREERSWDKLKPKNLRRVLDLMHDNILEEPDNDWNIRLWFQAARRLSDISIDSAIERLNHWHARSQSLEAVYCLYVLYALKAIDGSDFAKLQTDKLLEECRQKARLIPNRTFSFDWLGQGHEMERLIHFTRLGEFDNSEKAFYKNDSWLIRATGKIVRADRPEAGWIELQCGLRAFFVPYERRRAGVSNFTSQDVNKDVNFFLGFSYDGLRAWSVDFVK